MPSYGHQAKVVGGQIARIAGYVEVSFEVAGVKREIRVAVIPNDKVGCFLGANFVREFETLHYPVKNHSDRGERATRRPRGRRGFVR